MCANDSPKMVGNLMGKQKLSFYTAQAVSPVVSALIAQYSIMCKHLLN